MRRSGRPLIIAAYICLSVAATAVALIVVLWRLPLDRGPLGGIARVVAAVAGAGYLAAAGASGLLAIPGRPVQPRGLDAESINAARRISRRLTDAG